MDAEQEFRRKKLIALKNRLGRGAVALLGRQIGIDPSYISRMIAEPGAKQRRLISGDMVLAISRLYPDWLDGDEDMDKVAKPIQYAQNTAPNTMQISEPAGSSLSSDEIALIDYYRSTDSETRAYLQHLSGQTPKKRI